MSTLCLSQKLDSANDEVHLVDVDARTTSKLRLKNKFDTRVEIIVEEGQDILGIWKRV